MTEEEIKRKFAETYPDFMRGDEPLSPYFDIWEYAIEIMQEQIEKMKCCGNCAEKDKDDWYNDNWVNEACENCENQCNWKLKE